MPEPAASPAPRSAAALLRDRAFGSLFWGKLLATNGVWIHAVAAAILVYQATGSALMVSLVGVAQSGPQVVLAPLSGSMADRGDLVRQMAWGRVLCAVGSGALAIALAFPGSNVVGCVLGCTLCNGVGLVIGGPAMQSVVAQMIRPGELRVAMALNSAPVTLARVTGPVIGAYAVTTTSATAVFLVATSLHLSFVGLLFYGRLPRTVVASPRSTGSMAGLKHLRGQPRIVRMLLATAVLGASAEPMQTLAAPLAHRLGQDTEFVGHITLAFGLGAISMVWLTAWRGFTVSATNATLLGLALLAVGDLGVAVFRIPSPALVATFIAGAGFSMGMTGASITIQHLAVDEYRGRIMALWLMAFIGCRPIAAVTFGGLADVVSLTAACFVAALLPAAAMLGVRKRSP